MENIFWDKAKAVFTNYGVRGWKWGLQKYFQFDKWHIVSLRQRRYAREIIAFSNRRVNRKSFLEIGCGLGDILRNVRYENKTGYDLDQKVLNAAAFLNKISLGPAIHFGVFNFPESEITGKYDVILMVNWIHHIEPTVLKLKIQEYFANVLNGGGTIILDTVDHAEYQYRHDIFFLTKDIKANVNKLGDYERQRRIWLITKQD